MGRKNLFEKICVDWDMEADANRICEILHDRYSFGYDDGYRVQKYTYLEFVDQFCFEKWKNRGHFLDLKDFFESIHFSEVSFYAGKDPEEFVDFVEIECNLYYMAKKLLGKVNGKWEVYDTYTLLPQIIEDSLARLNYAIYYNPENEQAIVYEDRPEVTAVVEIEEDIDVAKEIIRYNHHSLRGNIREKQIILNKLGLQIEPFRKSISAHNYKLSSDIFFLLNNLNIRHNNYEKNDSIISQMNDVEIELWYDELYQMILFAKLSLDNDERSKRVAELKRIKDWDEQK